MQMIKILQGEKAALQKELVASTGKAEASKISSKFFRNSLVGITGANLFLLCCVTRGVAADDAKIQELTAEVERLSKRRW